MTKTKKPSRNKKQPAPETLIIEKQEGEEIWQSVARVYSSPVTQAALTQQQIAVGKQELHLEGLINNLNHQVEAVVNNKLDRPEAMLIAQAHTLDAIFNNMTQRAALNAVQHLDSCDTYLKLGLRAQSQCRSTLEALNEIKNPKSVAFVGQANIAGGHQQVNNGTQANNDPRAEGNQNPPNELMETQNGERVDFGTKAKAGGDDSPMEAVGAKHRTSNTRRKSEVLKQCL